MRLRCSPARPRCSPTELRCSFRNTTHQTEELLLKKNALEHYLRLMEEYPEMVQNIPLKYVTSYLGITVPSLSHIRAFIGSTEETPPFRR